MKQECGEVTTKEFDTAGNLIEEWVCYCNTTACLKQRDFKYSLSPDFGKLKKHNALKSVYDNCSRCGTVLMYHNPNCNH